MDPQAELPRARENAGQRRAKDMHRDLACGDVPTDRAPSALWRLGHGPQGASITPPTERHTLPHVRESPRSGAGQKRHARSSSWPACPKPSSSLTLLPDGLRVSPYVSQSQESVEPGDSAAVWPDPHSLLSPRARGHGPHFCSQAGRSQPGCFLPLHGLSSGKTLLQETISENSPILV